MDYGTNYLEERLKELMRLLPPSKFNKQDNLKPIPDKKNTKVVTSIKPTKKSKETTPKKDKKNKKSLKEIKRDWYQKHREEVLAKSNEYYKNKVKNDKKAIDREK